MEFEESGESYRRPFKRRFPSKKRAPKKDKAAARVVRRNLTPGRVTGLEPQVKHANRFNLYIDDHFSMGLSLNVAATVRIGQEMSGADLERLAHDQAMDEARERALGYLTVRPRSEQELRRYLAGKKYDKDIIDQVIARLGDVKLVDDRDFAKFWVENREGFKPRSKRALQYELRQKGVPQEEITRAVKKVDEKTSAYRAAQPKAQRWKDLDAKTFRDKLSGFLARRGFDYAVTRETVNRLWQEMNGTQPVQDDEWASD